MKKEFLKGFVKINDNFFIRTPCEVAQDLIGCIISLDEKRFFEIIETEAYSENDPASHSYKGLKNRNKSMFLKGGSLYVYLIYGVHYCLNIVTGKEGRGEAVLIRSLRDLDSNELIVGPGKVCKYLGINRKYDGKSLEELKIRIYKPTDRHFYITSTPRIGISKGRELPWRFLNSFYKNKLPKG